jgi:hypothetical protein
VINGKARVEAVDGWLKLPRYVVERLVAARLSLAATRVLLFLLREHLRHGGQENGKLKAPHRQLVALGIGAGLVVGAIQDLERTGLVRCHRRGRRRPSLFELTWLPTFEADKSGSATSAKGRAGDQSETKAATWFGGRSQKSAT